MEPRVEGRELQRSLAVEAPWHRTEGFRSESFGVWGLGFLVFRVWGFGV